MHLFSRWQKHAAGKHFFTTSAFPLSKISLFSGSCMQSYATKRKIHSFWFSQTVQLNLLEITLR